jgi:hypothetical protein
MLWTIQRSDSSVSKKKASFKNENSNSNCKCNSNSNSSSRNNTYIYAIIKSNTDSALLTSVNSCKWKPSWHSQYSPGMPKTSTRFLWHCQDSQSAFLEDLKMHSPIASLRQPPARCAIWVKRTNMMHTKPSQSNWIDPQPSLKSGVALQGRHWSVSAAAFVLWVIAQSGWSDMVRLFDAFECLSVLSAEGCHSARKPPLPQQ